ncbi:MAG TPA: nuclear transport factor 2 family protein [Gemmatimonadales bacterium]
MRLLTLAATCAALVGPTANAEAQTDRDAVLRVVVDLFTAMHEGDTTLLRSVFAPTATLVTTDTRDGVPVIVPGSIEGFIGAVGRPREQSWEERIYAPEVQISDGLASIWTWYTFHLGDRLSHCGIDAFQLARGPDGWKIIALADTRRRDGCDEVAARQPFN